MRVSVTKEIMNKKYIHSISIIIPIFNEANNIFFLLDEIYHHLNKLIDFEVILINDSSTDSFLEVFNKKKYSNVFLINNKINLGQSKSLQLGILKSNFDNIVTLDGDGQNNPKDIIKLLNIYFEKNYNLVSGIRIKRKDSFIKKISSKIANKIRSIILKDKCPDTGCSLKIFKKNCFVSIPYFNGIHRFIPALFLGFGYKVFYVSVDHRSRKFGKSKYGTFGRLLRGILDIYKVLNIIKANKLNA